MRREPQKSPHYTEGSLSDRFDAWVRSTLDNLIMTEVRSVARAKRRRKEILVDDLSEYASYDPFHEDEDDAVILGDTAIYLTDPKLIKALRKLSPRKQQVIEGTVLLAIPVNILAKQLNLSEHTISNYKYDAIQFLRDLMEGSDE